MIGWKNFADRLTGDECMNLSRALMSGLARRPFTGGVEVYKKYMREVGMTGVDRDHEVFSSPFLTDALDTFWGGRFDASPRGKRVNPKYFDINNLDDVNRLASSMNRNIALFVTSPPMPTPELWHDTYILASCYGDHDAASRPRMFFVVSYEESAYHLYKMRRPFHSMDTDPVHLLSEWVNVSRVCFVKSVLELLGFSRRHETLTDHACSPHHGGLLFGSDSDKPVLTSLVNRDIVFLAWSGLKKVYVRHHVRQKPINQRFVKLAVLKNVNNDTAGVDWRSAVYIVVDVVKGVMGKLREDHAAAYISEEPVINRQAENSKKRLEEAIRIEEERDSFSAAFATSVNSDRAGIWGFDDFRPELVSDDEEEEFGTGSVDKLAAEDDTCRCDTCVSSGRNFNKNMAGPTGQQKSYKTYNSADELLRILCWDDRDTLERLDAMSRLSLAAMDIESGTSSVTDRSFGSFEDTAILESMTKRKTPRVPVTRQVPYQVFHIDGERGESLSADDLPNSKYPLFSVSPQLSPEKMMVRYMRYVLRRHGILSALKLRLAAPILDRIEKYREAFVSFYTSEGVLSSDMNRCWKASLFGQLEHRIKSLAERLTVYSFNGANYDHVILASYILPALYSALPRSEKRRVSIRKRGNSVIYIKYGPLQFRDLRKQLPPNLNLRNFSTMMGLQEEKGIFPFRYLSSVEKLLSPSLPNNVSEWWSELSPPNRQITQSQVDAAIADFEARGFSNVGEYLAYYLVTKKQQNAGRQQKLTFFPYNF